MLPVTSGKKEKGKWLKQPNKIMNKLFENWRKFLTEEKVKGVDGKECWDGYKHAGSEDTDGDGKPDKDKCVPMEEDTDKDRMKCNSPRYIKKGEPGYGKKQKVVKACKDGEEKIIRFGDGKMENRSDNPKRKKAFRDRHNCSDKKDKFAAGYWSCKDW